MELQLISNDGTVFDSWYIPDEGHLFGKTLPEMRDIVNQSTLPVFYDWEDWKETADDHKREYADE